MSQDDAWGDDAYQPTESSDEQDEAATPDMEDALGEDDYDRMLDRGYSPPERPLAVDRPGTTAAEQREGESLDERLSEEVPDLGGASEDGRSGSAADADDAGDDADDAEAFDPEVGDRRSGRLVALDEGVEPVLDDMEATDVGIDDASASAEEAAVHEVDDEESGGAL